MDLLLRVDSVLVPFPTLESGDASGTSNLWIRISTKVTTNLLITAPCHNVKKARCSCQPQSLLSAVTCYQNMGIIVCSVQSKESTFLKELTFMYMYIHIYMCVDSWACVCLSACIYVKTQELTPGIFLDHSLCLSDWSIIHSLEITGWLVWLPHLF